MSYHIETANGIPISIDELNKEAAKFWEKEYKEDELISPTEAGKHESETYRILHQQRTNWKEIIFKNMNKCHAIHTRMFDGTLTWQMVKESIILSMIQPLIDGPQMYVAKKEACRPYLELIGRWEYLGYKIAETLA